MSLRKFQKAHSTKGMFLWLKSTLCLVMSAPSKLETSWRPLSPNGFWLMEHVPHFLLFFKWTNTQTKCFSSPYTINSSLGDHTKHKSTDKSWSSCPLFQISIRGHSASCCTHTTDTNYIKHYSCSSAQFRRLLLNLLWMRWVCSFHTVKALTRFTLELMYAGLSMKLSLDGSRREECCCALA